MKIRQGFVSNSSSSSFIVVTAGGKTILEDGDTDMEQCGFVSMDIDDLMTQLAEAKAGGAKTIEITHGGGYEG